MRSLVLFGLLLFGTASLALAQQRDTAARHDPATRRDNVLPRDTLLRSTLTNVDVNWWFEAVRFGP